jgi:hypothetical protein
MNFKFEFHSAPTTYFSTLRCSVTKGSKFYLDASKNLLSASSKLITFQIALRYCRKDKINILAVDHDVAYKEGSTKWCKQRQRMRVGFIYSMQGERTGNEREMARGCSSTNDNKVAGEKEERGRGKHIRQV